MPSAPLTMSTNDQQQIDTQDSRFFGSRAAAH
jgi:hypothetical protein